MLLMLFRKRRTRRRRSCYIDEPDKSISWLALQFRASSKTIHLREIYKTDVSIANFWSKPDDERTKPLGSHIDLDAIT